MMDPSTILDDPERRRSSRGSLLFASDSSLFGPENNSNVAAASDSSSNGSGEDPLAANDTMNNTTMNSTPNGLMRPLEEPLVGNHADTMPQEPTPNTNQRARTTSRLGDSCKFALVGLGLALVAVGLLSHYELSAVRTEEFYATAAAKVQDYNPNANANNFVPLQHLVGTLTTADSDGSNNSTTLLQDPTFGAALPNGVKLHRTAKMYQWVESEDMETKSGDYEYEADWWEFYQNSSDFIEQNHPENPPGMAYTSQEWQAASNVVLRIKDDSAQDFVLSQPLIDAIDFEQPLDDTNDFELAIDNIPNATIRQKARKDGEYLYIQGDSADERNPATDPKVGDYEIQYHGVPAGQTISVIAVVVENTSHDNNNNDQNQDRRLVNAPLLLPYKGLYGRQLLLLELGQHSAHDMLTRAQDAERQHLTVLRALCALLLYLGLLVLAQPLSILQDVVPGIGDLVGRPKRPSALIHWPTAVARLLPVAALLAGATTAFCWAGLYPARAVAYFALMGAGIYFAGVELEWWGNKSESVVGTSDANDNTNNTNSQYELVVDQPEEQEMMTELNEV